MITRFYNIEEMQKIFIVSQIGINSVQILSIKNQMIMYNFNVLYT